MRRDDGGRHAPALMVVGRQWANGKRVWICRDCGGWWPYTDRTTRTRVPVCDGDRSILRPTTPDDA